MITKITKADEYDEFTINYTVDLKVYHLPNKRIKIVTDRVDITDHMSCVDELLRFYSKEYRRIKRKMILKNRNINLDKYERYKRISTTLDFYE